MSVGRKAAQRLLHELGERPDQTNGELVDALADAYAPGAVYAGLQRLRYEHYIRRVGAPLTIGGAPNKWRLTPAGEAKRQSINTKKDATPCPTCICSYHGPDKSNRRFRTGCPAHDPKYGGDIRAVVDVELHRRRP